jgi:hypothetical protein
MADRVSQVTARALSNGDPDVRVSQVTVRVLSEITNKALVTQVTVRVLSENVPESGSRRQFYLCG